MPQYSYRPELKRPKALGGIDFGNPALAPMVGLVVQNLRKNTRAAGRHDAPCVFLAFPRQGGH